MSPGILMYRGFRTERKAKLKALHAVFQIVGLLFAIIALVAVVDSHNLHTDAEGKPAPIPNFYSLHSWMGLAVFILFCCQVSRPLLVDGMELSAMESVTYTYCIYLNGLSINLFRTLPPIIVGLMLLA